MEQELDESGKSVQYYYRVSDPQNPHIFSRVPYEKRSHWLKMWNPSNYPEDVSVYNAFNTLAYCFSFDYQVRFFLLLKESIYDVFPSFFIRSCLVNVLIYTTFSSIISNPRSQTYHNYAFGRFSGCEKALGDLKLALRAFGTISTKDTARGQPKYEQAIQDLKQSSGEIGESEHIFKFRSKPVDFKLLPLYETE